MLHLGAQRVHVGGMPVKMTSHAHSVQLAKFPCTQAWLLVTTAHVKLVAAADGSRHVVSARLVVSLQMEAVHRVQQGVGTKRLQWWWLCALQRRGPGSIAIAGSCARCRPGTQPSLNGTSCDKCSPGLFHRWANSVMGVLPVWRPFEQWGFACLPCAAGKFSVPIPYGSGDCEHCSFGYVSGAATHRHVAQVKPVNFIAVGVQQDFQFQRHQLQ